MSDPIEHDQAGKPADDAERAKIDRERAAPAVSEPDGFANDPDDSTNPNEVIERHRRRLRPRNSG